MKWEERGREGVREGEERDGRERREEEGIEREERGANPLGRRAIKFKLILFLAVERKRK